MDSQFINRALIVFLPLIFLFHDVAEGDAVNCTVIGSDNYCFYAYSDSGQRSWADARQFCASRSATLPVVTNNLIQNELFKFLEKLTGTQISGNAVWTEAHNVPVDLSVQWHWINGQRSNINVTQNGDSNGAKWATALESSSGSQILVSQQEWTGNKSYICQYTNENSSCSGFVYNSRCYKLHTDTVDWFQAAANCVVDGGTLASFNDNVLTDSGFHANWLSPSGGVAWIGLLKPWWIWTDGSDIIYNKFSGSSSRPPATPGTASLCVKVRANWEVVTCDSANFFVCQTVNSPTTSSTTVTSSAVLSTPQPTSSTTTTTSANLPTTSFTALSAASQQTTTTNNFYSVAVDSTTTTSSSSTTTTLAIATNISSAQQHTNVDNKVALGVGIGVGVGGFLLLAIIIVVVVLLVRRHRNNSKNNSNNGRSSVQKLTESQKSGQFRISNDVTAQSATHSHYDDVSNKPPTEPVYGSIVPIDGDVIKPDLITSNHSTDDHESVQYAELQQFSPLPTTTEPESDVDTYANV